MHALHVTVLADDAGRESIERSGRDGVHPHVLLAEVGSELLDGVLQRGLRRTHHVIPREDALRRLKSHRDDAPSLSHVVCRVPRDGYKRVGADVESCAEPLAARLHVRPSEVIAVGKGDGVNDEIDFSELVADLLNRALDVRVVAHVALDGLRVASPIGDQLFDATTHSLVLVRDGKLRAGLMEYLRDGPRDAPVVRDAEHDAGLSAQVNRVHGSVLLLRMEWYFPAHCRQRRGKRKGERFTALVCSERPA